jgi:hypothetical protein
VEEGIRSMGREGKEDRSVVVKMRLIEMKMVVMVVEAIKSTEIERQSGENSPLYSIEPQSRLPT